MAGKEFSLRVYKPYSCYRNQGYIRGKDFPLKDHKPSSCLQNQGYRAGMTFHWESTSHTVATESGVHDGEWLSIESPQALQLLQNQGYMTGKDFSLRVHKLYTCYRIRGTWWGRTFHWEFTSRTVAIIESRVHDGEGLCIESLQAVYCSCYRIRGTWQGMTFHCEFTSHTVATESGSTWQGRTFHWEITSHTVATESGVHGGEWLSIESPQAV